MNILPKSSQVRKMPPPQCLNYNELLFSTHLWAWNRVYRSSNLDWQCKSLNKVIIMHSLKDVALMVSEKKSMIKAFKPHPPPIRKYVNYFPWIHVSQQKKVVHSWSTWRTWCNVHIWNQNIDPKMHCNMRSWECALGIRHVPSVHLSKMHAEKQSRSVSASNVRLANTREHENWWWVKNKDEPVCFWKVHRCERCECQCEMGEMVGQVGKFTDSSEHHTQCS